jgi:hypothetical protein
MSGQIIATINLSLELVALLVGASMLLGAFDIIRQPGRVWQQAGESKPAYLILVLLLPIVGLALYAFMARPKLVALAAAGPTAPQPSDPPDAGVDEIHHRDDRAATTPVPLGSESAEQVVGPFEEPVAKEATPSAQSGPVEISTTFFSNKGSRTARARRSLVLSRRPKQPAGLAVEDSVEDVVEVPTDVSNKGSRTARARRGLVLSRRPKQRAGLAVEDSVEDVEQVEDNVEDNEVPTDFSNKGSRRARSRLGLILSQPLGRRPKQRAGLTVEDSVEHVEPVEDNVEANVEVNVEATELPTAPAGWKTDPSGRHQIRYWDGSHWTEHVADADNQATVNQPSDDQPGDDQTSDDQTEESAGSRPRARSRRLAVPYRR